MSWTAGGWWTTRRTCPVSSAGASKPRSEGSTETVRLSRSATTMAGRGERAGGRDARDGGCFEGRGVAGVRPAVRPAVRAGSRSPRRSIVAAETGQDTGNGTRTEDEIMQLGMIGLGKMGTGLTQRLLSGGHEVVAFDRDPGAVAAAKANGAVG